jgi:hypothetical protein
MSQNVEEDGKGVCRPDDSEDLGLPECRCTRGASHQAAHAETEHDASAPIERCQRDGIDRPCLVLA